MTTETAGVTPTKAGTSVPTGNQKFCTPQNLKNSMMYINHALCTFGFASSINVFQADAEEASQTVNCILTLLQAYQKNKDALSSTEERLKRLFSDNESQQNTIERLKLKLENTERELAAADAKLSQTVAANLSLTKENLALKEELKATKTNLQYSKNQYAHEIRKKDMEFAKIQQSLLKHMGASRQQKSDRQQPLITIINGSSIPLMRDEMDQQELEMGQTIIQDYEEREKELIDENQKLRIELYNSLKAIQEYVGVKFHAPPNLKSSSSESIINDEAVEKAQFFLPCDLTQTQLCSKIKQALDSLDQSLDAYREELIATVNQNDSRHREIELLREKLAEYKLVVDKQAKLIEMSLAQQSKRATAEKDSKTAANEKELLKEKERLKKDREILEKERKLFMEAAVKLGKERALFEQERVEFEQEKISKETKNVLASLPATPAWLRNSVNEVMIEKSMIVDTPTDNRAPLKPVAAAVSTPAAVNAINAIPVFVKGQENENTNRTNLPATMNQGDRKAVTAKPIMSTPGAIPSYLMQKSKHSPFDPQMSAIDVRTVEKTGSHSWTPLGKQIFDENTPKPASSVQARVSFK